MTLIGIRGRRAQRGAPFGCTQVLLCNNPWLLQTAKLPKGKKRIWVLPTWRRSKRFQFSHKVSSLLSNPKSIQLFKFFIMIFFLLQDSWTPLEMKAPMSIWDYLMPWIVSLLLPPCHKQSGQSLPGKTFSSFLTLPTTKWTWQQISPSSWDFLAWQAHEKFVCNTTLMQHHFILICFLRSRLRGIFQSGLESASAPNKLQYEKIIPTKPRCRFLTIKLEKICKIKNTCQILESISSHSCHIVFLWGYHSSLGPIFLSSLPHKTSAPTGGFQVTTKILWNFEAWLKNLLDFHASLGHLHKIIEQVELGSDLCRSPGPTHPDQPGSPRAICPGPCPDIF